MYITKIIMQENLPAWNMSAENFIVCEFVFGRSFLEELRNLDR